ncbi:T9SS C-terminal target domain-containing protein [Flavobacterium arcticum]|uniref:T9SS C-terminal target domain-containing protein n=1 Tax=Flavobacterium arcticum TaxID=1784713 RepID=A0A345HBB4_9FLAO|nr:M12 family metallo-peptidase [Flavobacterium arcticum]AXG73874.1 T9SS C-terminal target domain-containing protein [Flavobacterium arcticum]KAF2511825.1 T9SS type A sorting domain-containing protein [Flavobacterium arcticum]
MKKIIFIIALFLSAISFYGQNRIAQKIEVLNSQKTQFIKFTPLIATTAPVDNTIQKTVNNSLLATVNKSVIENIANNHYENIELDIPYSEGTITVQLYRVDILAEGFHTDTDKQNDVPFNKGAYYRGIIKGDATTVTSFNFFKDEMNGIISSSSINNLVIGKLHKTGNLTDYIIYSDADLNISNTFKCNAPEPKAAQFSGQKREAQSPAGTLSDRCVTMYFEIDNDIYLENESDEEFTINWMTSVFNSVQTLFDNDGITIALKSLYIWTEQDPYEGESSFEYLNQFNQIRPVFDGDVGQLVGIDPGGLGGVAATIDGLCSNSNYSYSDVNSLNFQEVPLFSWAVQVITHEFGHLLGSPHTHGCYWNGNNTAIDGCGTSAGFVEGNCEQSIIPTELEGGTIMSYCHLVPEVGINFANGFGMQPAQRILDNVNSSTCLSTDCINTCINTIATYTITEVTETTATITWIDESEGPWEVAYADINGEFTNWQPVDENTFTATTLDPNTYYKFSVRPVCPESTAPANDQLVFATTTDYCLGITFTDTGDIDGNYSNRETLTRTFIPTEDTNIIVTFTEFDLEADFDFLSVYDGATANAPLLGTFSGTTIPGPFESTAQDGSLTFVFTSDSFLTRTGWSADVTCAGIASVSDNTFSDFSYYPNPTTDVVNITSAENITDVWVYNVAGQLLLHNKANSNNTSTNIAPFAQGVYFFKIANGTKEANFRIIKQ